MNKEALNTATTVQRLLFATSENKCWTTSFRVFYSSTPLKKKKREHNTGTRNNIVWNNVLNTSASLLGSCHLWLGVLAYRHAWLRKRALFSPYFLSPCKFGGWRLSSSLRNLFIVLAIDSWIISLYCFSFQNVAFYNTIHFAFAEVSGSLTPD